LLAGVTHSRHHVVLRPVETVFHVPAPAPVGEW
jgi:hypothetical protein